MMDGRNLPHRGTGGGVMCITLRAVAHVHMAIGSRSVMARLPGAPHGTRGAHTLNTRKPWRRGVEGVLGDLL